MVERLAEDEGDAGSSPARPMPRGRLVAKDGRLSTERTRVRISPALLIPKRGGATAEPSDRPHGSDRSENGWRKHRRLATGAEVAGPDATTSAEWARARRAYQVSAGAG